MERVDQVERAVRYPIVGVMGSHTNAHADRSEQLGEFPGSVGCKRYVETRLAFIDSLDDRLRLVLGDGDRAMQHDVVQH